MLIQLLRSEPLEPRLENGKRLHYNFKFGELRKSEFVGIGIQENIQKITHLWG